MSEVTQSNLETKTPIFIKTRMTASLRAAHAESGVARCFKGRNAGRYAFMKRSSAVKYCKDWIRVLRIVRNQMPNEIADA